MRADAVFAVPKMDQYRERRRLAYVIGLPSNKVLSRLDTLHTARASQKRRKRRNRPPIEVETEYVQKQGQLRPAP